MNNVAVCKEEQNMADGVCTATQKQMNIVERLCTATRKQMNIV